jgi:predicted nucleic acid-binding Zn ribbon protein
MNFKSIEQLLQIFQGRPEWNDFRQYCHLLVLWPTIVDEKTTVNTRLLHLERQVLHIATSNSLWAQNLSLKRYQLLKKLNSQLDVPLLDLRFSPAYWHQNCHKDSNVERFLEDFPQNLTLSEFKNEDTILTDRFANDSPQSALRNWLEVLKSRSANLPLCPECDRSTPDRELELWGLCRYCMTKRTNQK